MPLSGPRLYAIIQRYRRPIAMSAYAGVCALAYAGAFLLLHDFRVPAEAWEVFGATLPLLVLLRLGASRIFGLTTGRWRFVGTEDIVRLVGATLAGSAAFALLLVAVTPLPSVRPSLLVAEWILSTGGTAAVWVSYRIAFERLRNIGATGNGQARRALVVGAGEAGGLLARELQRLPTGTRLAGFVDDDPLKWGTTLHRARVIGGTADLEDLARISRADEIIIAVPSASPAELRSIVERCKAVPLPFKVLPGIEEVFEGDVGLGYLRPLRVEDLLAREPITLELPELRSDLEGRSVLITGGAGSIGSELARQATANGAGRIVLLDRAESALYLLARELESRNGRPLEVVPLVGDVLDEGLVREVFRRYAPERVFHAAANKHVPLMEGNPRQAFANNVVGTWRVARAAAESGAEKFVLVSTDKAVDPRSVMGATKRMAERIVAAYAARRLAPASATSFLAVRFGNVLGSSGSVIPVFRAQLDRGEPLTVTHPEATRYFMMVSEAVQLVLQASILEEAEGRIVMLDMGEPVRILDLARNMIRLSGLREGIDAHIEISGLRPGDKLHERLSDEHERALPTSVEKVRILESTLEPAEALHLPWASPEEAEADGAACAPAELAVLLGLPADAPTGDVTFPARVRP